MPDKPLPPGRGPGDAGEAVILRFPAQPRGLHAVPDAPLANASPSPGAAEAAIADSVRFENELDRLEELEQELRGLQEAFAGALARLALSAPRPELGRDITQIAGRLQDTFQAQLVLLGLLLDP